MSLLGLTSPLKCEGKDASGGDDRLDGLASQEADASSEVSVCLLVLSFYLDMWNADVKFEKQGL